MISKDLVMKVVDAVVVIALIVAGVGVLFGFDGFGMDVLLAFVAFGVATLLVDSKKGTMEFVMDVVDDAKDAVDEIVDDASAEGKEKLRDLINYTQKALDELEKKVQ
jgi:hypothetical protein